MARHDDAVGAITLELMLRHGADAPGVVDERIDEANAHQDWNALNEWHRVRLRMKRLSAIRFSAAHAAPAVHDHNPRPSGF